MPTQLMHTVEEAPDTGGAAPASGDLAGSNPETTSEPLVRPPGMPAMMPLGAVSSLATDETAESLAEEMSGAGVIGTTSSGRTSRAESERAIVVVEVLLA